MGFNPARVVRKFFSDIRHAPEAQYITSAAAQSQFPSEQSLVVPEKVHYIETTRALSNDWSSITGPADPQLPPRPEADKKKSGGVLDKVVKAAGSRWALGFVLALLVTWGVLGAVFGPTDTWQVLLQDVSSIQSYSSATLLMRQQNNNTRTLLGRICGLMSRSKSNERMVRSLTTEQRAKLRTSTHRARSDILAALQAKEDGFDKVSNAVAKFTGSLLALGMYTSAIIAWVFLGIPSQFSDTWQLWVNTGTALEITFVTMFLQNIRRQHEEHLDKTVQTIDQIDKELEIQLRRMTGDMTPNPVVASEPLKLSRWVKAIDIYAYIIGGYIGISISAVVFGIWISIGDSLEFDDNWWLIIGTYTGLIGFIDGFILKNVDARETKLATKQFAELAAQDAKVFALLGLPAPAESQVGKKRSINLRISAVIGRWVESTLASYTAVSTVGGLLLVATGMQWTETGQLLCNTPTMIVEGFLLITLLQAHNMADERRRLTYMDILSRRLALDRHLAAGNEEGDFASVMDEKSEVVVETYYAEGPDVEEGKAF